ncbi:hypothetical protein MOQ_007452 [Trypanosoma cruzi marinkellei]|uniref:Uncharacterized protein n=1 Tax=Trypanosoma cruzi marinkellei TaxID=85056 RepID=K2M1F8_TRYCR|nr:hypothetical protein MOQ_007452 [Trypanosoma cruzi marinkellei]
MPLPSCTSPWNGHSGTEEEERRFCALDVTTWSTLTWNERISGIVFDIRGVYNYWHQVDDQASFAFDSLVACTDALEAEWDPTDCFMYMGNTLLQEFWMQLMMASDPASRSAKLAPDFTPPRMSMIPLRGHPASHGTARDATSETQPGEITRGSDGRQKTAEAPPPMNADVGSSIHSATSRHFAQASHRTADAPPDISNCPTQPSRRAMELIRQRRSTMARRIAGIPVFGQLHEESGRVGSRGVGAVNVGA